MFDSDPGQTSWDNLQHHGTSWNPGKQLRGGDEAYLHASNSATLFTGGGFSCPGNTWNVWRQFCSGGGGALWHLLGRLNILQTQVSPYSNEPSRVKAKKCRGTQITWNRGHPSPVPINRRGLPQSWNCPEESRTPSISPLWFLSEWKVKGTTVNLPHVSLCPVLPPRNKHLIIIDIATCTIYMECLCSHLDNSGGKTGLLFHHCKIFHYLNPKGAR